VPTIPSARINLPPMMVAERIAHWDAHWDASAMEDRSTIRASCR
jgi:hypothetical protein